MSKDSLHDDQPPAKTRFRLLDEPGVSILLVEGSPLNQRLVRLQLEKLGCVVGTANTGRKALHFVREGMSYALILLDCQMTDANALQVARAIRRWEKVHGGRVILVAMSARVLQSDRQQCIAAGMDDYVSKPVMPDILREVLERWTPLARATSQLSAPAVPLLSEDTLSASLVLRNLREITGNDAELLIEITGLFLSETSIRLLDIYDAIASKDAQALEEAAYRLKVSSGYMEAQAVVQLCSELGALGRAGTLAGATELYERLAEEYASLKLALEAEGNRLVFQGRY